MNTEHEMQERRRWRAIEVISHYLVIWLPLFTAFAFAGLFLLPYATLALVSFCLALYLWSDFVSKASISLKKIVLLLIVVGLLAFGVFMTVQQIIVWIWGYPPLPGN